MHPFSVCIGLDQIPVFHHRLNCRDGSFADGIIRLGNRAAIFFFEGAYQARFCIKNRLIAKSEISKITSVKGKMTVNYKKLNVDKYQINYSLSPTMKDYKTVYVKGADNLKTTISNLVSGKKYYVKLRGIKRVNKVNYYTPYGNYTEIMVK